MPFTQLLYLAANLNLIYKYYLATQIQQLILSSEMIYLHTKFTTIINYLYTYIIFYLISINQ